MADEESQNGVSKVELEKLASNHLRGTVREVLADESIIAFEHSDLTVLKFHGIYQQDDRDARVARKKAGLDKAYSMMIRIGLPGGQCSADQYIALDDLCVSHANGSLRLTTRQAIQLHGVLKGNLKETMATIQRNLMSSLAACGDIPRNFMAPPAPFATPIYQEVQRLARELKQDLAPATGAYIQIWLDGEQAADTDGEEPFYGEVYLPRKFKVALAIDTDNSVDVYANDCGLIAVTDGADTARGYNITVGGGFGMTHKKAETIARIASPVCFVPPHLAKEAVRTVVAIYRDCGNREERRQARIKYLMEQWGPEKFRAEMSARMGIDLALPAPLQRPHQHDNMGRFHQGDGREFLGVFVENGRVADFENGPKYKTAFRKIVERLGCPVRVTPMQSILFIDLTPQQADEAIAILRAHGIKPVSELSNIRRWSMACVALPTCGLALTDSERVMPGIVDMLEQLFEEEGLADAELTVRMTGCPNGCARPYNADIGFVGRKPGVYNIHIGGGLSGDRIADLYAPDVRVEDFCDTLRPLLRAYRECRDPDQSLSDFYQQRMGRTGNRILITGDEAPTSGLVNLTVSA